ncbi:hypothetical protein JTF06_12035 [Desemzia sp. RIT804]|uniref:hypothetical protein n=1 Tax=Desemzia sp. RIT 804 TaxID=2810209 RepID=UPI0019515787|nr:hypothetical protein [Desemzia sp. RIT 804]MBM6615615.1 hypothetical protein [Desemzia sp. RIT 804]
MARDVDIERDKLRKILKEILKKDVRKKTRTLSIEVFGDRNKISNGLNSTQNINEIKRIRNEMENYCQKMRDYSSYTDDDLVRACTNLIANKGYSKTEVSLLMGKFENYTYMAFFKKTRHSLLDIFDFASTIVNKNKNKNKNNNTTKINETSVHAEKPVNKQEESNEEKIIAKIGEMYLVELVTGDEGETIIELSLKREDATEMKASLLDSKEKLKKIVGLKFIKIKKVVSYIEEEI